MDIAALSAPSPWFKDWRVLGVGAVFAVALALTSVAFGVASARTDGAGVEQRTSAGELSVVVQPAKERSVFTHSASKLATLDPAMAGQASDVRSDQAGDENLRLIAAQERRLTLMNEREARAFADEMRQNRRDDSALERESRPSPDKPDAAKSYTTSNSTDNEPSSD